MARCLPLVLLAELMIWTYGSGLTEGRSWHSTTPTPKCLLPMALGGMPPVLA